MADYSDIQDKAEEAVKALITAAAAPALSGLDLNVGLSAEALDASRIEILSPEAEEHDETGNWLVTIVVKLVTNANASFSPAASVRAMHRARWAALADICMRTAFVIDLNTAYAVEEFTAMAWTGFTQRRSVEGKQLMSEFQGKLLCNGSNP